MTPEELKSKADAIRISAMEMVKRSGTAHLGSALSMADLLAVLYFDFLQIDPANPDAPERDRFILSKGHGGSGLYAALTERGFFSKEQMENYGKDGSTFAVHPSSKMVPGVEVSTGSLGHGLGLGVGMALAGKLDQKNYRTVVLMSDGECDEGSNWEAILAAGHWKLGNLLAIVDYNKIQSFGRTADVMDLEPFSDKWKAFGWEPREVNGHNCEEIQKALGAFPFGSDKPSVIIAHTVKGKGWEKMEDQVASHYTPPVDEDIDALTAFCNT